MDIDAETVTEQKKLLEEEQSLRKNQIVEADEAAGSAEGMDDRSDNMHEDVQEDRDATPPDAIEDLL